MCKLKAGEVAAWATERAIQILGGNGYTREYPVERMHRDSKIYDDLRGHLRDPAPGDLPRDLGHPHPLSRWWCARRVARGGTPEAGGRGAVGLLRQAPGLAWHAPAGRVGPDRSRRMRRGWFTCRAVGWSNAAGRPRRVPRQRHRTVR